MKPYIDPTKKMSIVVSGWFANALERALIAGARTTNENVIKFCRNEIRPIYEQAIEQTNGRMVDKFKKTFKEMAFESEEDIRIYLEIRG